VSGRSGTETCALGANQSRSTISAHIPRGLLVIALLFGAASIHRDRGAFTSVAQPRSSSQWAKLYSALPLSFEANGGQTDRTVDFLSRGRGYTLFLTDGNAVLTLRHQRAASQPPVAANSGRQTPESVVRVRVVGANTHLTAAGGDLLPGKANYFIGNDPAKWHRDLPTYAKVTYENVYPGVDLVYYGTQGGQLEYDFVVSPGADAKAIGLEIGTQESSPRVNKKNLRISTEGDLMVSTGDGELQFHKPVIYQQSRKGGPRTAIQGRYVLSASNQVHFAVGSYDHTLPLVIDPVLVYSTYVGGSGGDVGYGIAVDANLDAYITGGTNSSNFPTAAALGSSAHQTAYGGNGDAFILKVNYEGAKLLYSTYLGGSGSDTATAIAETAGNVFVTGSTTSTDFPVAVPPGPGTPTAFQPAYGGGGSDAFVTQLNTTGNALVYSSYLGGTGADFGQGIDVDSSGDAYVTGSTQSTNFPILNPLQANNAGSSDVFVTKVNPTGEQLLYSTYLGGSSADVAQSIQIDTSGDMYIAGYTFSSDFPTQGPYQKSLTGSPNAFVAKINTGGSTLVYSTYVGGSGNDRANGLALDSTNNVYIVGTTSSTDFPVTTGAFQTTNHGPSNAFICKLNPAGSGLLYSTYLGGSALDQGNGIAVNSAGNVFVTGSTESSDFPLLNPIQSVLGISAGPLCGTAQCTDAFVSQLNAAGNALVCSTFLGGSGPDFGQAIALDYTGDPYITGSTSSTNFPATPLAYNSTLTGAAGNMFVAKIDSANESGLAIDPAVLNFGNETLSVTSPLQTVYLINAGTAPLTITSIVVSASVGNQPVFAETDNCVGTLNPSGAYCTMNVTFTPSATGSDTGTITITDNNLAVPSSTQTITLTGSGVTAATAVTVSPTSLSFANQAVGTISSPQNVTITNTGNETLNITKIATSNTDYEETNTCLAVLNTLAPGQACSVSVTFTPTASGARSGTLSIQDNATGSPQTVSLTGNGLAAFNLTSPSAVNPATIGATSSTYTIEANGPTSFNGNISLACSTGVTCTFNPTSIFIGNTSTMTVSNLTTSLPNPYAFQVIGTSGTQTSALQLNLYFEDFTVNATPPIQTIEAGTPASYTIVLNPLNGFDQRVQLTCSNLPPDATCVFGNATPVLNGTSSTNVALTVNTVKYVAPTHAPPRYPTDKIPPGVWGLLGMLGLANLALGSKRRAQPGRWGCNWFGIRLAALSLILVLNLALAACRPNIFVVQGTTTGNYSITINGILASNTAVIRSTTVNLAVTPTGPTVD
jgi:hypothetical protein